MQPTNKNERRKAFWNFLGLFILCIIIITTTIFFSIQVPFKQNDQLVKDMGVSKKERDFSEKFMSDMSAITGMLDSINTKAANPEIFNEEISAKINKLNLFVEADSGTNKIDYTNAVLALADLKDSKKQLRDRTGNEFDKAGLKIETQVLRKSLDSALAAIREKDNTIQKMLKQ